ncbi:MAG TPA: hypothetical protein VNS19_14750, partial [Acidimicrobiales bacterium]|nr:hypothetical protein [Acidimicrobiales bacterium]
MSPLPSLRPLPTVAPGLIVEAVGDELLVCAPDGGEVHRLAGPARGTFEAVASGAPATDQPALHALEALGLVASTRSSLTRRQLLVGAATTLGAVGIATVILPDAAAAASSFTGGTDDGTPAPGASEPTTTTAQPTTTTTEAAPTTTTTSAPPTTTTTAAPTTTTTTPGGTLNGGGTITGLGTFVDSAKGVTFV